MCYISLVQSNIDGHLSWFQVFAIVNTAAMNMCTYLYSRMIYNPLDIYPVMGLLGQMQVLFLGPWGSPTLSSTMVELTYIPISSVKCSYFSSSSPASVVSRFFNNHHSDWREVVSQCSFDLQFSNDQWWWAFFHMFLGLINVFYWKMSVHVLCPLLNGFVFFLVNLF